MASGLFKPIPVQYGGLYADDHFIDAQELGVSLQGLGKLANGIVHFYLNGQVAKDSRLYRVRIYAGPPRPGSLWYEIFALMQSGQLPLYAPLLFELAAELVPRIARAVVDVAVGKRADMEGTINRLIDMANRHAEFANAVHQGHMRDKAWLQDHISLLAGQHRAPLRELVAPVGKSCRQIKVGEEGITDPASLDEAEAAVLLSKDKLEVGDMQQFHGVFEAVDTTNGTCKILIDGDEVPLRGKITDPALMSVQNVYTHSLDTKRQVVITAKPVLKDGKITSLYISDGKAITDVSNP